MCRRASRGHTLVEALTYAALLPVLLGAMYVVFQSHVQVFYGQSGSVELVHGAMSGLVRLERELSSGARASTRIESDGIIFASGADDDGKVAFDSSGRIVWQKWVCFYLDASRGLCRAEQPFSSSIPNPPGEPVAGPGPMVPADLTVAWFRANTPEPRLIAPDVNELSVTGYSPLEISMQLSNAPLGTSRPNAVRIRGRAWMRNL